jgi:leucyl aminopeptidase (aminopeptidase T)
MVAKARADAAALEPPWSEWLTTDINRRSQKVADTTEHLRAGMQALQAIVTHLNASVDAYELMTEIVKQLQQAAERELFDLQARQADVSRVQARQEHLSQRLQNIAEWQAKIESVLAGAQQFNSQFETRLAAVEPDRFATVHTAGTGKPN